jgi:hypothetical protein
VLLFFEQFMEPELPEPEPEQQILFSDLLSTYQAGKDELNLAEFPISAIGSRLDPSVKTIIFQDRTFDKASGETITRKLTITASDQYGLPTASDDEILLGLLQLSRIQNFNSSTVTFTPYQLLKILGWSVNTSNYRRLKESINRWMGVTLYYENAWREDKARWVDVSLHFLEQVEFYKPGQEAALSANGYSVFKWNDIVFRNFREGNLKELDFQIYRTLEGAIAKRLFRFLDKRFFMRRELTFDLEAFACEKIGLSRPVKTNPAGRVTTDVGQIKRRLLPAVKELEDIGFIQPMPSEKRFTKDGAGKWEVHFARPEPPPDPEQTAAAAVVESEDITPLEGRLVGHGITRAQARKLVSEFNDERIQAQLDALEYLLARGGESAPTNRAGWLVKAVTEDYSAPRGFKSRAQLAEEARQRAEKALDREEQARLQKAEMAAQCAREDAQWEEDQTRIRQHLASLPPEDRAELELAALRASPFGLSAISIKLRQATIDNFVLDILNGRSSA